MTLARTSFALIAGILSALLISAVSALPTVSEAAQVNSPKRVALVMGNSAYQSITTLDNPKNDATDVAAALKKLGFDVTLELDLTHNRMVEAITAFQEKSKGAGASLVFYAGHGIALNNENYLIPVDVPNELKVSDDEAKAYEQLKQHLISLQPLDQAIGSAEVGLMFMDACRNRPGSESEQTRGLGLEVVAVDATKGKTRTLAFSRGNDGGTRSAADSAEPGQLDASMNKKSILRVFATRPNFPSLDGDLNGRNSPFTKALLANMTKKIEVVKMAREVMNAVLASTNNAQKPMMEHEMLKDFYLASVEPSTENGGGLGKAPVTTNREGGTNTKSQVRKQNGGSSEPKTQARRPSTGGGGGRLPPGMGSFGGGAG